MRKTAIIFCLILASAGLRAQNLSDLIISEAMKGSEVSVTDEYGCHCDWIEIFNTSQGTVNFAGCFLTDDPSDLTKCQIPKGPALCFRTKRKGCIPFEFHFAQRLHDLSGQQRRKDHNRFFGYPLRTC